VLANDSDPDGNPLTAILVSGPSHGTVTLNSNGSFTYTPAANHNGPDSYTYRANDGTTNSNVATVNITVIPVNDAPVAVNDAYSTNEDTPLTVAAPGVLANDSDPDGNPLTAIFVSGPSHGTVTLNSNGSFTYTPAANYNGPDSYTYRANDGTTNSNVATVNITVIPVNDAPVAVNDAYSTNEDTSLTVAAPGVLANDSDPEGSPLTAVPVTGPSHGTVTQNSNGSFTYAPTSNYCGTDSFTYRANDGTTNSNVATVTLSVNCTSDVPVAVNDTYSTNEDTPLTVAAPGVLANDSDPDGNPLTAILVSGPSHGTVTLNSNGSFTYTPAANYNGPDSYTYRANDGTTNSNVATVNITVIPVNDVPVAVNDAYSTNEDTPLTVAAPGVLANDSDPEGNPLTAVPVTGPSHGTVTQNSNGSFTYTPTTNYCGVDSFTYRANDGTTNSNVATVSLTVNCANDAPVAVNDAYTTPEDTRLTVAAPGILANDSDPDGSPLTAVLVTGPSHGTLTQNANGSFTYTPAANYNGPDSYTYRANDGTTSSNIATVSITVTPVNDPPVAVNDSYTTNQNTTLNIPAPGVLANDSDPDGNPLTAVLVTGPSHGTLTQNANGSFTYTPASGYTGPDSYTYRANDGTANSNIATVNITVNSTVADLSLTKSVDRSTPAVGSNVTFTIIVSNAGPGSATNVAVSDVLPAGLTFVSATASQGSYSAGTGVWTVGTIAGGSSSTLNITATVTTFGAKTNIAQVIASDQTDPDSTPNNNSSGEDDQDSETVTPQLAQAMVAHTTTTCASYLNGTGGDLTAIEYGVKSGKINNVAPGVFFYYVQVQAPSSNFTIVVDQSENHASFSTLFGVQNGQVQLYNADCSVSSLGTASVQNGDVTINVSGATAGQLLVVSVKYDASTVVNQIPPDPTTVNYNFVTQVNGTFVSQDGVALVKKGTTVAATSTSTTSTQPTTSGKTRTQKTTTQTSTDEAFADEAFVNDLSA
jgi:VCBS repeat-containing protein